MSNTTSPLWNTELITKYDLSGPRYTSYPTALQFNDSVTESSWQACVAESNHAARPLSLYFHIPFCDTVCFYCGCHRIITADRKRTLPYLSHLLRELALQAQAIDASRIVKQIHWGGGTPTYLSDAQITEVMASVRSHFELASDEDGEYGIEIHPASVDQKRIAALRDIGFNRLSMGIQDFDPSVQTAVNRFNSVAEVERLFAAARKAQYQSISVDLMYGLPRQSVNTFQNTLTHVVALNPDRISLFNYAHMPHLFKMQRQIDTSKLPEPQEKLAMLHDAITTLSAAGYVYIGMDHFAKTHDDLAIAQKEKRLHRNFQGYATHNDCDLFSFGVSSISAINGNMFQNEKKLDDYYAKLSENTLPISRGVQLNDDDRLRAHIISELMCNFALNFSEIETQFGITFHTYFKAELSALGSYVKDGLVAFDDKNLEVLLPGRMLVRKLCMIFDRYLGVEKTPTAPRYSRII